MNSIRGHRDFLRAIVVMGSAALAISPLLGGSAHAVTITGSTYASETGGPTPNPTSASYNMTNLSSVSASIKSSVADSYAESYASAMVTASGVVKTTGGLGWTNTATTQYNARADVWNASATGTTIEANYTGLGTAPSTAPFQFSLPASILTAADPYYSNGAPPGDPTSMLLPVSGSGANQTVAQGVVANGVGNSSLPSSLDVIVNVQAIAYDGIKGSPGVTGTSLFNGGYEFDTNTGVFTPSGDFATALETIMAGNGTPVVITQSSDPSMPGYLITFGSDILGGTFDAPVGSPFSVDIETSVSMGDPSNPTDFDFSSLNDPQGLIGAGGSVTAQLLLTDTADFSVSAVPEPSTFFLAALAAVGLLLPLRRRNVRCAK